MKISVSFLSLALVGLCAFVHAVPVPTRVSDLAAREFQLDDLISRGGSESPSSPSIGGEAGRVDHSEPGHGPEIFPQSQNQGLKPAKEVGEMSPHFRSGLPKLKLEIPSGTSSSVPVPASGPAPSLHPSFEQASTSDGSLRELKFSTPPSTNPSPYRPRTLFELNRPLSPLIFRHTPSDGSVSAMSVGIGFTPKSSTASHESPEAGPGPSARQNSAHSSYSSTRDVVIHHNPDFSELDGSMPDVTSQSPWPQGGIRFSHKGDRFRTLNVDGLSDEELAERENWRKEEARKREEEEEAHERRESLKAKRTGGKDVDSLLGRKPKAT